MSISIMKTKKEGEVYLVLPLKIFGSLSTDNAHLRIEEKYLDSIMDAIIAYKEDKL